jgi:hypothetical protein
VTKALAVGLSLVLSTGVVYAQSKKAPPRRKAPATKSPKSDDKQPTSPTPDAAPAKGGEATPQSPSAPAQPPAAPAPTGQPPAAPATGGPADTAKGSRTPPKPMKTDEKAGTNETLQPSGPKTVSKTNEDCAQAAFQRGNDLLNNGLFPQSVAQYREAIKCWDHPAIHYNLALALINLDQPIEVFDQLNIAVLYGADPLGQDKYDHAKEYLKLVAGQLADVEVSCNMAGAKIAVDGKEVFVAPGTFKAKVRVGKHTFYGEKEGYNARVTAPFIGPGDTFRIELKLYTLPELTRYRCKWNCGTKVPYYVIGGGVLAGIVGGVLTWRSQKNYDDFNTNVAKCSMPVPDLQNTVTGCPTSMSGILNDRNSGDTKRTMSYVGYGVAGAAIATGAVLLYLNRREGYQIKPEDLEEEKTARPSVSVAPLVSPEMTGAMVLGHF